MAATKDQERKALEKIRKILGELGEDSYLSIAFEGCLGDAEMNIENDWGCSMYQRWSFERKSHVASEKALEATKNELRHLYEEVAKLKAMILTCDEMESIGAIVRDAIAGNDNKTAEFAAEIVDRADNPGSEDFAFSVRKHRAAVSRAEQLEKLHDRIASVIRNS